MTHVITLCFFLWCWCGSIHRAGCYSDARPGSCWVQECRCSAVWVARFPREDAIIRVYHLEKSWTKAGKWSGVVGIFEILNAAVGNCNVAAWELERHLARPPGADEAVFISLTFRVRYVHMVAPGRRMSPYEVAMQCNTREYLAARYLSSPFRSLLHRHEYIDYRLPAMWPPNDVNAFNNRNPNLPSLLRLTIDEYVRTNIPPLHQTV